MKFLDEFRNPDVATKMIEKIDQLAKENPDLTCKVMEVCGSHTMAIARYGIRNRLPSNLELVSGPGCPVCVTDAGYIDTAIELSRRDVTIITFGDLINVPGSCSSLVDARSEGADIRTCYSPFHAIEVAEKIPDKEVVFLGIGFETTIPVVISLVDAAMKKKIGNLSVLTAFKRVLPAMNALTADSELGIDGFLCPAHVSAIIGSNAYDGFVRKNSIPCVIASFEPVEMIMGLATLYEMILTNDASVVNQYARVVRDNGNLKALTLIDKYLETSNAHWRGIGAIPSSGYRIRDEYSSYDAGKRFGFSISPGTPDKRCRCGDVLKGKINPGQCALFANGCDPSRPVGPCMVSSEGSCSAWYKYCR